MIISQGIPHMHFFMNMHKYSKTEWIRDLKHGRRAPDSLSSSFIPVSQLGCCGLRTHLVSWGIIHCPLHLMNHMNLPSTVAYERQASLIRIRCTISGTSYVYHNMYLMIEDLDNLSSHVAFIHSFCLFGPWQHQLMRSINIFKEVWAK